MCLQGSKSGPFPQPNQSYYCLCFSMNRVFKWYADLTPSCLCESTTIFVACVRAYMRMPAVIHMSFIQSWETGKIHGSCNGVIEDSYILECDCVFRRVVPGISEYHVSSPTVCAWRWHSITSQKIWILSNETVTKSIYITTFCYFCDNHTLYSKRTAEVV
jgi:hypothetical protein